MRGRFIVRVIDYYGIKMFEVLNILCFFGKSVYIFVMDDFLF